MKILNLSTEEQNTGIFPHATTHHLGGTDPISAEAIGAETEGTAAATIAAHVAASNPHPQYAGGGTVTYNFTQSSTAFTEEFDDFLSMSGMNKLGWGTSAQNGWLGAEKGNRFPGTFGVFTLGIYGNGQSTGNFAHLRLGAFPVIPLASEGYTNIELSAVVGLANFVQTEIGFSSRFGLLDTGAGWGTDFSVLISAEFFDGAYNWVAHWRSGDGNTNRHTITSVSGNLASKTFALKIKIDCENHLILFDVDGATYTGNIAPSAWLFGAMSPIFFIQRNAIIAGDTQNRAFYVDKYLFRKNVTDELPPASPEVEWADILNKPILFDSDWDLVDAKPTVFPPSTHAHDWQEISGMPSYATAADINSAIQQHRDSPDGTQHRWDQISGTPDFPSPTNPTFSFRTGWTHYASTGEVSCRAIGRLVKWGGLAQRTTTSGNTIIGAMPSHDYRPAKNQMFMSWAYWAGAYHAVRLDVNDFGSISIAYPTPPISVITWVSLAPICYYASA